MAPVYLVPSVEPATLHPKVEPPEGDVVVETQHKDSRQPRRTLIFLHEEGVDVKAFASRFIARIAEEDAKELVPGRRLGPWWKILFPHRKSLTQQGRPYWFIKDFIEDDEGDFPREMKESIDGVRRLAKGEADALRNHRNLVLCGVGQGAAIALHVYLMDGCTYGGLLLCDAWTPLLKRMSDTIEKFDKKPFESEGPDSVQAGTEALVEIKKEPTGSPSLLRGQSRVSNKSSEVGENKDTYAWDGVVEFYEQLKMPDPPTSLRFSVAKTSDLDLRQIWVGQCVHKDQRNQRRQIAGKILVPCGLTVTEWSEKAEFHMMSSDNFGTVDYFIQFLKWFVIKTFTGKIDPD